jgi:hypothetical protein
VARIAVAFSRSTLPDYPWAVYEGSQRYAAKRVVFKVDSVTEGTAQSKGHPRFYLVCNGQLEFSSDHKTITIHPLEPARTLPGQEDGI